MATHDYTIIEKFKARVVKIEQGVIRELEATEMLRS
jgi:ABC-type ATPase involved in cell division